MNGFVTIDKKILKWEWYTSIKEYKLFTHLILTANFTKGVFRGKLVKRGQLITSLSHLSADTGLTIQNVRTALENLQKSNDIIVEVHNHYSLITVVNYEKYQNKNTLKINTQTNTQSNTQSNTQTRTQTNNNINNTNKAGRNSKISTARFTPPTLDDVRTYFRDQHFTANPVDFYTDSLTTDWKQKAKEYNNGK